MNGVFIDTQIWVYSKKKPQKEFFVKKDIFERAVRSHKEALTFFQGLKESNPTIYMTTQQIAELYHTLSFRGMRLPTNEVTIFIESLRLRNGIIIAEITIPNILEAIKKSNQSKIHLWDYLCVIPIKRHISIVYTNDVHFKDETFKGLGFEVKNPISAWEKI